MKHAWVWSTTNEQGALEMQTESRGARSDTKPKRKRFSWMVGILVSSVFIVILVFVVVTLLVLRSQGVTQGINRLLLSSSGERRHGRHWQDQSSRYFG